MKKLPSLTAKEVIQVLKRLGFEEDRQRGSHLVLIDSLTKKRVVIPVRPGKSLKKPLLKSIIEKEAGISVEEFSKFL